MANPLGEGLPYPLQPVCANFTNCSDYSHAK